MSKLQIIQGLKDLVNNQTKNIRTEFCLVDKYNPDDNTYDLTPLSGDTQILGALVYESEVGSIKPKIGSVVSVAFYDDTIAYLVNIRDYEDYTLLTERNNTIASKDELDLVGRSVNLIAAEEITSSFLSQLKTELRVPEEGINLIALQSAILLAAKIMVMDAEDGIELNSLIIRTISDLLEMQANDKITVDAPEIQNNTSSFKINGAEIRQTLTSIQSFCTNALQAITVINAATPGNPASAQVALLATDLQQINNQISQL